MKNYKKQTRNILRWERKQMLINMAYGSVSGLVGVIIGMLLCRYA
jgi:hypothetical protein